MKPCMALHREEPKAIGDNVHQVSMSLSIPGSMSVHGCCLMPAEWLRSLLKGRQ